MMPDTLSPSHMNAEFRRDIVRIWVDLLRRHRFGILSIGALSLLPPLYGLMGFLGFDPLTTDGDNGAMRARRSLPISRKIEASALWLFAVVLCPICGLALAQLSWLLLRQLPIQNLAEIHLVVGLLCACMACMEVAAILMVLLALEPEIRRRSIMTLIATAPIALLLLVAIFAGPTCVLVLVATGNDYSTLVWSAIVLLLPVLPTSYRMRHESMRSIHGSRQRRILRLLNRHYKMSYQYESKLNEYLTAHLRAFLFVAVAAGAVQLYEAFFASAKSIMESFVGVATIYGLAFPLLMAYVHVGLSLRAYRSLPMRVISLGGLLHGAQLFSTCMYGLTMYIVMLMQPDLALRFTLITLGVGAWFTWCIPLELRLKRKNSLPNILAIVWILITLLACAACFANPEQSEEALILFTAAGWMASPLAVLWSIRLLRRNSFVYRSSPGARLDLSNVPQE